MKRILLTLLVIFSVLQAGITFTTGSRVYIGNANLLVYGNITNNLVKDGSGTKLATIDFLPTSKVSFVGSSNDTITNIYTFPNIEISKPSGSVRLNNSTGNFTLTGNLNFVQGNFLTGTNTFELGSSATVTNETAARYIVGNVKSARVVGTGSNTFGGIGYSMSTGTGNLGTVTVYRYSGTGNQVTIYGSPGILRKWTVETSNAFSGTRQVTASWLSNEDNGNVLANLKAWKYVAAKDAIEDDESGEEDVVRRLIEKNDKLLAKNTDKNMAENIIRDYDFDEEGYHILADEPKTLGWVEVDGAVFNTAASPRTATFTMDAATTFTINDTSNIFADGAGTVSNPYQIATLDQLNAVRSYLSAHFIQTANIDASATTGWNSGAGWLPIPNFAGKYNGDGHTVSNLYISRAGTSNVGLFGITNAGSEIKDIGLINIDITGGSYTGGFVGYSRGTVKNSFAKGSVKSSTGSWTGGFVGYAFTGSNIGNCYANVEVTRLAGGTETANIGAFCGRLYNTPITYSYSTGGVNYEGTTNPTNKGFLGGFGTGSTMTGNFWNIETSGQTSTAGTATGLTKDQMRTLSVFTNAAWDFQGESVNGTEDIWGINAALNSGYPFLSWEGITHNPSPFAGGIGTSDEPFLVSTLTQLDAVRNFLSYNFLQTADIDASPTSTWDAGAGWMPIGNNITPFTGNYNGDSHKIDGLYINRSATSYVALFGFSSGSIVENLHLHNVDITGSGYVAGLIGYMNNSSLVDNCSVKGSITGTANYVAPISGYVLNTSVISNSFADAQSRSIGYVAGLAGRLGAGSQAVNCYAKGTASRISGTSTFTGGITGYNNASKILKCYSTVKVIHEDAANPSNKGITSGVSATGDYEMADNFWDIEVSGQTSSAGVATGKTTAQMKNVATYTSIATAGLTNPWDFVGNPYDDIANTNIWNIHTSLNDGYPYLNWEYRISVEAPSNLALTIGAINVTISWNAVTGATGYIVYSSADPYGTFILDGTGIFNGTEWTAPLTATKMFYYVAAVNDTKINENKVIMVRSSSK